MLSGGTQRRDFPRHQIRAHKLKILNISFSQVRIEPTIRPAYTHTLVPCAMTGLIFLNVQFKSMNKLPIYSLPFVNISMR